MEKYRIYYWGDPEKEYEDQDILSFEADAYDLDTALRQFYIVNPRAVVKNVDHMVVQWYPERLGFEEFFFEVPQHVVENISGNLVVNVGLFRVDEGLIVVQIKFSDFTGRQMWLREQHIKENRK